MTIETLNKNDVSLLNELEPAGWGSILPAHEFYTSNTDFCFPIRINNDTKIVGIGTAVIHNDVAWLAHIIVHAENRNQGIGRLITQSLVNNSQAKNCDTIYLIATDLGAPVTPKLVLKRKQNISFLRI